MSRIVPHTLIAICITCSASAQPEALAKDFEKLSAKERARIAKVEQQEALNDASYQNVMQEAEVLFQQDRYEEALAKFNEARSMRPYNVYPKVKIQDLQALIAKRDAALRNEEAPPAPVEMPNGSLNEQPAVAATPSDAPVATASEPQPRPTAERVMPHTRPAPGGSLEPPVRVVKDPEAMPPPRVSEEGERVYKEGRSVVLEKSVAIEGRIVVFRKVSHPWGEVNHFQDGRAISAREYDQAVRSR